MKNMIMYKEGEVSFVRWIKKRIDENLNFMSILTGPTGVGKSWGALEIANLIDPEFLPEEQVAFSFLDMMRIINRFNDKDDDDNPLTKKKYKIIIFDEAQTSVNKRNWQSKFNKLFLYLVSTFRHQNFIVLFTSPYSDFMDSATMKLIHCEFSCMGWNKKTKMSQIRPKLLQWNGNQQKFYYHRLFVIRNKKPSKLVDWRVGMPPKEMVDVYERMKTTFTNKLNAKITRELMALEKDEDEDKIDHRKELTERQEEIMEAMVKLKSPRKVAEEFGISMSAVSDCVRACRKKGYRLREMMKDG